MLQIVSSALKAEDLLPLVQRLPASEQILLAKLALRAAATDGELDGERYASHPPEAGEFDSEDDPLAWDGAGWDEFDAPR